MVPLLFATLLASLISPALAAFGYTTSGNNFLVDAGSSNALVISVSRSSCDINSIKYRGVELQEPEKGTHISSGLGSATVSATQITGSDGVRYVKITCDTSTLTQYYVVREADSTLFAATYITAEPDIGELRFIARLKSSVLPSEYPFGAVSTTSNSQSTVEGSDVFVVNGQTRSKFYSSERFIDKNAQCVYGDTVDLIHACVLVPQYESSSGGPFFRDIETNNAGAATNIYNYMNSGHVQTEDWRMGLHGPYLLQFSRSGIPKLSDVNTSFMSQLSIKGFVPESERGRVSGTVSGIDRSQHPQAVVHWFNSAAQYWTYASSGGSFTSPYMKPGTYTMVLYQTEFKVAQQTVTVSRGSTTSSNIASTLPSRNLIWQIGKLDGQPTGFRNADKFLRMHPSDSRMSSWGPLTYTVGSSSENDMAMALFKEVNNGQVINFNLNSVPSGTVTLRIATTLSFAGARPQATVNSWTGPAPAAPANLNSRGVTRGAYRGFGEVYDVTIPSGTLKTGSNTIKINVISGSSGATFLSPNIILDSIQLYSS